MKSLTRKQIGVWALVLTGVFELITVILRFGFNLESARDTASTIGVLTHGIRIHHGYVGVLVVIIALLSSKTRPVLSRWMLVAGTALVCSDLIHHFAVFWPIIGSPGFDLFY